MVLVNVVALTILKISFPCICLQITAEVRRITKSIQCSITFIFTLLSETTNSFVKMRLLLESSVAGIVKTLFN